MLFLQPDIRRASGSVETGQLHCCRAGGSARAGGTQLQFAVGFKGQGKTGHVVVDAEDALVAALKVKMRQPEALITYVRRRNKRGDARHPMHGIGGDDK